MCDDKPFACSAMGCGMRFSTEDHLNVHIRKHEMSLALNLGGGGISASLGHPFLDQTPTPTKFLKNCEEIGLFQELSKNPFEEAFKKAADLPEGVPLPGPHSNDLNTPVPPDPSRLDSVIEASKGLAHPLCIKEEPDKDSGVIAIEETEALDLSGRRELVKHVAPQPLATSEAAVPTRVAPCIPGLANTTVLPVKPVVTNSIVEMMSSPPVTMSNVAVVQPSPVVPTPIVPTPIVPAPVLTTPVLAAPTTTAGSSQPMYTMQVFLQLPSGQTVPVNIPATIGPMGQQPILQQKATTPVSPITTTPTTLPTSTMALKQRLKQSLQQNNPPMAVIKSEPISHGPTSTIPSPTIMLPESVSTSPLDSPIQSPDNLEFMDSEFSESGYPESGKRRRGDDDTDDRRRKFLERNRAAAARCRQKRKGWINNLEKKADDLSNTNSRLQSEVSLLRGEVAQLKTLLLAHKDCPITLQQKSQGHIALATINLVESGASASVPTITSSEVSAAVAGATDSITLSSGITVIPMSAEHLVVAQELGKN